MRKKLIAFFLTVIVITQASAQGVNGFSTAPNPEAAGFSSSRLSRIDRVLEAYVTSEQLPGAVAFIARDGKIVYHKAFGYSDAEKKTTLRKDNIFRIASQSKAITSTAVMMLWEEGRFLLDEPVSKYIPEFKAPKVLKDFHPADSSYTAEPAASEITIRQLLTHTSGIDYAAIGSAEFKAIYAKAKIPSGIGNHQGIIAEKIKVLATLPLKHQPGERWTYGLNHDVLGYLIEIWSGMPFDQFLKTRLFEPLGMNDTYFYLPKEKHNRLVALHHDREGKTAKVKEAIYDGVNPEYPTLAGTYFSGGAGLSSTIEDYAKFLQMYLNKGDFNGTRILSRKTIDMILTDQLPTFGNEYGLAFGLETSSNDYLTALSPGSFSWGGAFNTQYWADPKERLIGVIFTNVYNTRYWQTGDKFKALTYQAIND